MNILTFFKFLRVHQWIKNLFVFAPLIFAGRLLERPDVIATLEVFIAFCFTASSLYIFNDVQDREADRFHPKKRFRPIASGAVPLVTASLIACLLLATGLSLGFSVGSTPGLLLTLYAVLNIFYTLKLKHVVIVDILIISAGFVLRLVAGAEAIAVPISPWIIMCGFLLALFLAATKRRQELLLLKPVLKNENQTREVLDHYSVKLLDQIIIITLSATVLSYFLYTFNANEHRGMMWTAVFVFYGIFRYLYLIDRPAINDDPTQILLSDRPLFFNTVAWALTIIFILYFLP